METKNKSFPPFSQPTAISWAFPWRPALAGWTKQTQFLAGIVRVSWPLLAQHCPKYLRLGVWQTDPPVSGKVTSDIRLGAILQLPTDWLKTLQATISLWSPLTKPICSLFFFFYPLRDVQCIISLFILKKSSIYRKLQDYICKWKRLSFLLRDVQCIHV